MNLDQPSFIGETQALTHWFDAVDSYKPDPNDNSKKTAFVTGCIVRTATVDLVASDHFGEETLKWTLAIQSKYILSNAKDVAIQPIKPTTIAEYEGRFPGAFVQYRERFGDDELPRRKAGVTEGMNRALLGEYKPPVVSTKLLDARKAELLKELEKIEAAKTGQSEYMPTPAELHEGSDMDTAGGTEIQYLKGVPTKAKVTLLGMGINTIEKLAALSSDTFASLGVGDWEKYRGLAERFLEAQANNQAA